MQGSFSSFAKESQPVSSGTLSALIQLQRQDLLTGLVELTYSEGVQALLFFNLGTPFALYSYQGEHWRKVPNTQWNDVFAQPHGKASVIPLGGDGVRVCLLALESAQGRSEEILLRPGGFLELMKQVKARETVSLLRVRDEALHGLVVVPGRGLGLEDVLVFSPAGIQSDLKSLVRLLGDDDRLIRVSHVEFLPQSELMQEYALKVVFLGMVIPALTRFEQLAGDTLLESLGREVNNYAFHQGWKIQIYGNRVTHRQFFPEPGEALLVYRGLLRVMRHYIHQVVGASLAVNIIKEGVAQLSGTYLDAFQRGNFLSVN